MSVVIIGKAVEQNRIRQLVAQAMQVKIFLRRQLAGDDDLNLKGLFTDMIYPRRRFFNR